MSYRIIRAQRAGAAELPRSVAADRTIVRRQAELRAEERARGIIDQAQREAAVISARATEEAKAVFAEARASAAAQSAGELIRLHGKIEENARGWERQMERLAVHVAEKIIGQQLSLAPEMINSIVDRCLRSARSSRRLTICLHPEDAPLVQARLGQWAEELETANIIVEEEAQLERGSCVVRTEFGEVDGRLSTQLQAVLEVLTGE